MSHARRRNNLILGVLDIERIEIKDVFIEVID